MTITLMYDATKREFFNMDTGTPVKVSSVNVLRAAGFEVELRY